MTRASPTDTLFNHGTGFIWENLKFSAFRPIVKGEVIGRLFDLRRDSIHSRWKLLAKARENLLCAEDATNHQWHNASASRLYYAVYQAGKEFVEANGESRAKGRWEHPDLFNMVSFLTRGQEGSILNQMRHIRQLADYERAAVRPGQLSNEFNRAWDFLNFVYSDLLKKNAT